VLAIFYFFTLVYLFFGISIVADLFMGAIEKIASRKVMTTFVSEGQTIERPVLYWNATIANLTLMALGSSAPEIILAVLDTATTLGSCPGELGASTIVGSAAFNLLVISGLSVYAVAQDPAKKEDDVNPVTGCKNGYKRINDMGVFGVTASFSVIAYIWLYIALIDMQIELWEAIVTLALFPVLVGIAYFADQMNSKEEDNVDKVNIPPIAL
jgi:solute carrier family 8 (sodium/calcium exchanger)